MSSTQASITSASSERRASRPIDSAITRIASAGSMKQSIMGATIGAGSDGKGSETGYGRAMLSDRWWFWAVVACVVAFGALGSARYRDWAAHLRARALARRLVEPGTGRRIDTRPGGLWSDTSWLLMLLGAWVAGSPWIWGYDGVHGAIAADVITGAAVIALSAAGIVLPPFNALTVLAGLWLVLAPWLVGYG